MRENDKIGMLLRAIMDSLLNKNENFSISAENLFKQTNELLISEIGFDLDMFLTLDESASKKYLSQFNGINADNLALMAEVIFQFGINKQSDNKRICLEKALQLYELSERTDKTFSVDRKRKIQEIKNAL